MLYFTADTHFGSKRALELSKRPFSSVEEMDREMIKNWNKKVSANDTVFHLGDFGNTDVIDELPGTIYILYGNYERDIRPNFYKYSPKVKPLTSIYYNINYYRLKMLNGDKNKYEYDVLKSLGLDYGNQLIIRIMHKPSLHSDQEFLFNLYGHIHGRQMIRRYGMDVGVDCHHFSPVSLDDVFFYWNAILNHYDNEVFDERHHYHI